MKILIVSFGKAHDANLKDAIEDFSLRISRTTPLEWKLLPSSKKIGDAGKKEEAEMLAKIENTGDFLVSLDERGKEFSSNDFANFFQKRMNDGAKRIVFVIGGSYGLHDEVVARSNLVLSLSKLTFPHQLVRLVLSEQIYRAFSIIAGLKYHHE